MKKISMSGVATGILVACALTVTAGVVRRDFLGGGTQAADVRPLPAGPANQVRASGLMIGDPQARETLTVFSDYQCPYCARFDSAMTQLMAASPRLFAVRARDLPLPG